MSKVDTLYQSFLDREVAWQNQTDVIFSQAEFITTGVINYLDLPVDQIKWESIDVIGQEMLIQVTVPNDDRFQYVELGEHNVQTLTIVLPVSVVEAEDSDLITAFLHDTEDVRKHDHRELQPEEDAQGVVGYSTGSNRTLH
jgi:hypothetical protein